MTLETMHVRRAIPGDAAAIADVIRRNAHLFTVDPTGRGAEAYFATVTPSAIEDLIRSERFAYDLGIVQGEVAGIVAMRDHAHLYHLFVAPEFHRRGYARVLWRHAMDAAIAAAGTRRFTVHATPFALPAYERFGFRAIAPRVERHGVAFVTMELDLDARGEA